MDPASILLILKLVSEGVGVVKEVADLAKRVKDGETITDVEIQAARTAIDSAVSGWDAERDRRTGEGD